MAVKRRRLPNFESCSVALFASLAVGSTTLPARAQGAAPVTRSVASTTAVAPAATLRRVPDGSISSPDFDESLK